MKSVLSDSNLSLKSVPLLKSVKYTRTTGELEREATWNWEWIHTPSKIHCWTLHPIDFSSTQPVRMDGRRMNLDSVRYNQLWKIYWSFLKSPWEKFIFPVTFWFILLGSKRFKDWQMEFCLIRKPDLNFKIDSLPDLLSVWHFWNFLGRDTNQCRISMNPKPTPLSSSFSHLYWDSSFGWKWKRIIRKHEVLFGL